MDKSSVKNVRDLEHRTLVLFPRLQLDGIPFTEVEKDLFSAECICIEGQGEFWIITQTDYPRMVFQVFLAKDLAHFDMILGQLLGLPDNPIYIKDCYDFIVVYQGNHDYVPITQTNYKDVTNEIRSMHHKATCWWYEYGKEALIINNM